MRLTSFLLATSLLVACAAPNSLEASAQAAPETPSANASASTSEPATSAAPTEQSQSATSPLLAAANPFQVSARASGPYTQKMLCSDGETEYDLLLSPDGRLQASAGKTGPTLPGPYTVSGGQIDIVVPAINFRERSQQVRQMGKLLVEFRTPSLGCGLSGHTEGPAVDGAATFAVLGAAV